MSEANTIHIRVFMADGTPVNLNFAFENGLPLHATELTKRVQDAGYLLTVPGAKPGEDVETMTHVMKRLQFNKSDNTTTPTIGLYHESKGLLFAYWQLYLNTPADISDFESAAGVKVAELPLLEDSAFPKRDDHFKQKYLVELPQPIKARFTKEKYLKEDGKEASRPKTFEGFLGSTPQPAPSSTPPASGKPDGNDTVAIDDMLLGYTVHMYDHPNHQKASLELLYKNGKLTTDMKPFPAACHVLMHRAMTDYMMTESDVKTALGKSLKDHLATDGHNLVTAWNMITVWFASHQAQAKPKAQ